MILYDQSLITGYNVQSKYGLLGAYYDFLGAYYDFLGAYFDFWGRTLET